MLTFLKAKALKYGLKCGWCCCIHHEYTKTDFVNFFPTVLTLFYITPVWFEMYDPNCFKWFYNCIDLNYSICNQVSRFKTLWKQCEKLHHQIYILNIHMFEIYTICVFSLNVVNLFVKNKIKYWLAFRKENRDKFASLFERYLWNWSSCFR
jgi:hypothetical protein